MKFSVPVIYTTSGWLLIEADTYCGAKEKARALNKDGVEYFNIKDATVDAEVMVDEIEVIDNA